MDICELIFVTNCMKILSCIYVLTFMLLDVTELIFLKISNMLIQNLNIF
jgi:hypothetical protein